MNEFYERAKHILNNKSSGSPERTIERAVALSLMAIVVELQAIQSALAKLQESAEQQR